MTFKAQLQTLAGLTPEQAARVEIAVKLSLAMPPLGDEALRQLAAIGFKEAGKGYTKTVRHAVGNGTHTLEVTPTGRGRYNFTVTAHVAPRSVTAVLKLGIALPEVVTLANKYSDPATVLNLPQVQAARQEQGGRRVSSQGATRVALYGAPAKALNPAQARVAQLDAYAKQNLSGPVKIGGHGSIMGNVTWLRIEIGGKEYRLTPQHLDQATLNQLAQMKTKDANVAGNRNVIKRLVADMLLPPTKALKAADEKQLLAARFWEAVIKKYGDSEAGTVRAWINSLKSGTVEWWRNASLAAIVAEKHGRIGRYGYDQDKYEKVRDDIFAMAKRMGLNVGMMQW